MILTTTFLLPAKQHYSAYTPPRPSPLTECSANAAPRLFDFSMASQSSEKKPPVQQRVYKANPIIQTRDATAKRRRDMFFRRVQNGREDKKWEARGEQIQQLDFVSERKRWEAEKARQAPPEHEDIDEEVLEDMTLPESPKHASQLEEMTEADHIAAQEEYELQQLIALMEQDSDTRSQHYGSDDEDYDSIFMECATSVHQGYQPYQEHLQHENTAYEASDAMDMDMTDG
ncbi:Nn.00g063130.m01.CDS01 [Neocucurbitaria sp. VM-36]